MSRSGSPNRRSTHPQTHPPKRPKVRGVVDCRGLRGGLVGAGADAGEGVDAAVAEPVAGALDGEDLGVVNDAVDQCRGFGLIAEHPTPARERQ